MDEQERREYLEDYAKAKERGIPFWPDAIFKDVVVGFAVILALVGLAFVFGAPLEERADPADTSYTPRPEWYFLFLFQLLKYFPGSLEVVGVIVIPTVVLLVLFALPFLDRSGKRHFKTRPAVMAAVGAMGIGVLALTVLAMAEAEPPQEIAQGDTTAALYAANCAGCHGPTIDVPVGTDLHSIIELGRHEGMPAWGADLSTDEIDALAGFVLSPRGDTVFVASCAGCHDASEVAAGDPFELRASLEQGSSYPPHADQEVPEWGDVLTLEDQTALLNFLVAPDGQRLYAVNCSSCHGSALVFSGTEDELRSVILEGGRHLEMPPWRDILPESDLELLARYTESPSDVPEAAALFQQNCAGCHGDRVPVAESYDAAYQVIASGMAHETMPVWGDVLTEAQVGALAAYTMEAALGLPTVRGGEIYAQMCASCHGTFGEGGPHPADPSRVIAPISTAEYLSTRDDWTIRAIITQGQEDLGMAPFGAVRGGPLSTEDVDAVVAFIRAWESNPPVEEPPQITVGPVTGGAVQVYREFCSQCHGSAGEGGIGPSLASRDYQEGTDDAGIFASIEAGHPGTAMIAWGEVLTTDQVEGLVEYIRTFAETGDSDGNGGVTTFVGDILPLFTAKCTACHGALGGWDGTTYDAAINSGEHGPAVIPGDPDNSPLVQKLYGTTDYGGIMPPAGALPEDQIQIVIDWIAGGALEK